MKTPFWEVNLRYKQYMKYLEDKEKAMKEATSSIRSGSSRGTSKIHAGSIGRY